MSEPNPIILPLSGLLMVCAGVLAAVAIFLLVLAGLVLIPGVYEWIEAARSGMLPAALSIASLAGAITAGAWFYVVKILRRVVKTVIAGDPFVPENISRLRYIWVIIAAAEVFRMCVKLFSNYQNSGTMDIDIRIGTWFLVFVIATLAEAFRYGAEMRREQELTI